MSRVVALGAIALVSCPLVGLGLAPETHVLGPADPVAPLAVLPLALLLAEPGLAVALLVDAVAPALELPRTTAAAAPLLAPGSRVRPEVPAADRATRETQAPRGRQAFPCRRARTREGVASSPGSKQDEPACASIQGLPRTWWSTRRGAPSLDTGEGVLLKLNSEARGQPNRRGEITGPGARAPSGHRDHPPPSWIERPSSSARRPPVTGPPRTATGVGHDLLASPPPLREAALTRRIARPGTPCSPSTTPRPSRIPRG